MTVNVFAVPVFFICFRECLETSIIVSVLLAFLKQSVGGEGDRETYKRLLRQVWIGVALGLFICLCVGAGFIGAFYSLGKDVFSKTEDIWEGTFSLVASLIISIMGAALLRVNKLQDKWRVKLQQALDKKDKVASSGLMSRFKLWSEKHVMFILPFITVLREGLEAVVYIGGVSLGLPASSFPLAVICGLAAGCVVGYIIYRGGNTTSLQIFLIISTGFLYLVAAGLFSKAVWAFEIHAWNNIIGGDAAEVGSGPGSYNIHQSVWHVNCCNAELNGGGGWGIFNAILGWQNSATIGSVVSYNVYWLTIIICFLSMTYMERYGNLGVFTPLTRCFGIRKKGALDLGDSSDNGVVATSGEKSTMPEVTRIQLES
ncbi:high-affinity iron transporter [Fusarium austroafricanum]|uniref:High-affinity iron transporter n=1 Tax=Fusarium austroafricanum TaxID=2364996 RepID=A0A8H4NU69_9HYPO|nr:high-affinity iron transporter [Fusarium austroafricanum]